MALSLDDRVAVTDLINRHGHLCDNGELDRLHELFTADAVYDVTDLGGGVLIGPAAMRAAALALGDGNPVAHHITNIVLTETDREVVHARSKAFGVMADGSVGSLTYEDTMIWGPDGWRISRRVVRRRRRPLTR
jgi:3-phenylpropionate/cinnamic acid dioxygenase small subunit